MNTWKFASLMLMLFSVILVLLGGMYNPNAIVKTLPPGQIDMFEFSMNSGESVKLHIKSTDYITIYIFNESSGKNLSRENFTSALYESTIIDSWIIFTAPEEGKYYLVVANVNSPGFVQVTVEYGRSNNLPLLISGSTLGAVSIGIVIREIRRSKSILPKDSHCPRCGAEVRSDWNYCPVCRFELGGGKR